MNCLKNPGKHMENHEMNPLLLHCRKLFLRRHEVWAQIGVHDFEKGAAQRIWIDVDLYDPYATSTPQADRLDEVVDYDFVRAVIAERVQQGPIELQETLCDDLVQHLLQHPGVHAVRLSTCKPDVYPDCDAVGVEVFKFKPRATDMGKKS
jgi:dihydroneopterin aldolase